MKSAVYPGSFDPVTYGHVDMIERAASIFDKVIVCVMVNMNKQYMFTSEERCAFIRKAVAHIPNVEVDVSSAMLVDYARQRGCAAIIKGLRTAQDFEFEMQMAMTNKVLNASIETFFMMADNRYSYLSSSVVREVMAFGGDVLEFVPPHVEKAMRIKYGKDYAK